MSGPQKLLNPRATGSVCLLVMILVKYALPRAPGSVGPFYSRVRRLVAAVLPSLALRAPSRPSLFLAGFLSLIWYSRDWLSVAR